MRVTIVDDASGWVAIYVDDKLKCVGDGFSPEDVLRAVGVEFKEIGFDGKGRDYPRALTELDVY